MVIDRIALILTIIGALNWGLVGLFEYDLVRAIFGDMTLMARIIYTLVGFSAIIAPFGIGICERNQMNNEHKCHTCNF